MKKTAIIFLFLLFAQASLAQNMIAQLEGINYQAVALDHEGSQIPGEDIVNKPLYEREIGVRFTLDQGPNGTEVYYADEHTVVTDKYGLFNLVIGQGEVLGSGSYIDLLSIPWINGDQWLKVEISIHNDGNYLLVSYQKLMAVPFSFYTDDIADNSITTYKVVDETLQAVDIDTGAVETSEILNETILAEDIATGAVETSEILNETILAEDIATGAVETSEILNETILAEDIATGAVETSEILNETILAEDIATGAVETSEILNETILAEDIATGAVTSSEILNETILNEDIAPSTIDLTTKVTNVLPVANGGTGVSTLQANSLVLGNDANPVSTIPKATDSSLLFSSDVQNPVWKKIAAGQGIQIIYSSDSIILANTITGGVTANGNQTINVGVISSGSTYVSPAFPVPGSGQLGDIILGSIDKNLQGCMMTTYFTTGNTAKVAIFNGTNGNVNLGQVTVKLLVVQ